MKSVKTRIHDAVLTATENMVIPRVELAIKSDIVSSGRGIDSVVLDPDLRDFSGNIEGLQKSTINSKPVLKRIDKTSGNIAVEEGDLAVNGRNSVRETQVHHLVTGQNAQKEFFEFASGYIRAQRRVHSTTTQNQTIVTRHHVIYIIWETKRKIDWSIYVN